MVLMAPREIRGQGNGVACGLFGDDAHGAELERKGLRRVKDDAMFAVFGVRVVHNVVP